jgi:hypothetical protein
LIAVVLWGFESQAEDCRYYSYGTAITEPGCYRLKYDIIDPIHIRSDNVSLDLNGFAVACRGGRGKGISITRSDNVEVYGGTLRGCDWGVDAYSWGQNGDLNFRDLQISGMGLRGIQAHGNVVVERVVVTDTGPSRMDDFCLTAGVDLLGPQLAVTDLVVLRTDATGEIPDCEAVGLAITGPGNATLWGVTVINERPPRFKQHIGIWLGGSVSSLVSRPIISGTWYGVLRSSDVHNVTLHAILDVKDEREDPWRH